MKTAKFFLIPIATVFIFLVLIVYLSVPGITVSRLLWL